MQPELFDNDPLEWKYHMTYDESARKLSQTNGRAAQLGPWRSCTYLAQHDHYNAIDNNGNEIVRIYPIGTCVVRFKQFGRHRRTPDRVAIKTESIWCERRTANQYFTYNRKWWFYQYRHHTMIKRIRKIEDMVRGGGWECPSEIRFDANGDTNQNLFGLSFSQLQARYKHDDYVREKPRRRGRFWQARVRNLYLSRKECQHNGNIRKGCERGHTWQRRPEVFTRPFKWGCGCFTYRKELKFKYTVEKILNEPNATVRTCMIKLYGVDKFFKDTNSHELDRQNNYQLLRIILSKTYRRDRSGNSVPTIDMDMLTALRMVCPSTGSTYVNLVPNSCSTVKFAINWMYNVSDYKGTVGVET